MKIHDVLNDYVGNVVGLNSSISPNLLNRLVAPPVHPDLINSEIDPFKSYQPNSLFDSRKFYGFTKQSDICIFWDKDTPRTIKELLVIAAKNNKNYWFFRRPISVLTDFLLSIKNDDLVEVNTLKNKIKALRTPDNYSQSVFRLKVLLDNFVSSLVSSYIYFIKSMSDFEQGLFIFKRIQSDTLAFTNNVEALLKNIDDEDFHISWNGFRHIFTDFSTFSNFDEEAFNDAKN